jgi:CubicO group peptidase (beta-lactamase class C family)
VTDWRGSLPGRLAEAARRHGVPGAAVAVGHGGDLVEAAYGVLDVRTGAAVTPDSLFHVGSVTKPWTATLVLQLVDEGRLDLDAPVVGYLPAFAVADPAATAAVTARQLLAHTGGFAGDLFLDTGDGDDAADRYLERLRTEAVQVYPPGAMFSYCNSGFCVLGALVARLRGTTWETAVRERVAGPLGVRHMALSAAGAGAFATATGHLDSRRAVDDTKLPRSNAAAGSMMRAAPRELVRFGREIGTVLSADAVAAMRTPQVAAPGAVGRDGDHWGLGLELWTWSGVAIVGHDGGVPGQAAVWRVVPGHDLVVALSINADAATTGMTDDVVVPLVEELAGVTAPSRPVAPRPAVDVGDLGRFAGRYATPLWEFEVTADGAGLVVRRTPRGLVAEMGRAPRTDRFVGLAGDTFVTAGPVDGTHDTITFVDGGRYLHAGRAAARIG